MSGKRIPKTKNWDLDAFPPEIAAELQYRQPMRVSETMVFTMLRGQTGFAVCPRCKLTMEYEYAAFCGRCGQRLNWSRYKHAEIRKPGSHTKSE